jgi:SAM-dependent methyltransferase
MEDPLTRYARAHDMDSWLRDPRIAARGFAHRWQSSVAAGNGEDAFISLVEQHIRPEYDVLDLGCGHGELTLALAARCHTIVGIEREPGYLELAKELAAERNTTNAQFFQVNLAGAADGDRVFAGIPLPDGSIDLFVNRRGPILSRYLDEAIRVARRGAVIVGLHPGNRNTPAPPWQDELPEPYRGVFGPSSFEEVARWVTDPLDRAGIVDYSLWWTDVPEFLRDPHELYVRLGGPDIPGARTYQDVEPRLARIFEQYRSPLGVVLRHQRLLWQARLPK